MSALASHGDVSSVHSGIRRCARTGPPHGVFAARWRARLRFVAALGLAPTALLGCMVVPVPEAVELESYAPMYYRGHIVFFDDGGLPIYYVDGVAYEVPREYPRYYLLTRHFHRHAHAYRAWFDRSGYHHARPTHVRPAPQPSPHPHTHR